MEYSSSETLSTLSSNNNQEGVSDDVIEIDDEWDAGDDERVRLNDGAPGRELDEGEGIIDLDPVIPPNDVLQTCPFCSKSFVDISRLVSIQELVQRCQPVPRLTKYIDQRVEEHINNCADDPHLRRCISTPTSSSTPGTSSGKEKQGTNVFSVLMSSHTENEAWKEASVAEDRNFRATKTSRRKAPFYKVMQGMPIAVDAFKYGIIPGVTAYFLTHAHSDHYTNLSSSWKAGPIYCSEGTAKLIIHLLSVDPKWVHPLAMDIPVTIPDTSDVTVTLIEANHCCPGSSLFLFEGRQTVDAGDSAYKSPYVGSSRIFRYLHCGDFRASPQHVLHPAVKGKRIDTVYLDTTYLNPKHTFPSQKQVISACAELSKKLVDGQHVSLTGGGKGTMQTMDKWCSVAISKKEDKDIVKLNRTLVIVGTYSIGKERIVKGPSIATALNTKVYCDSRKAAILRCQQDSELNAMLTKDPYAAGVHVVPLSVITSDRIKEYTERWKGHWSKAIGFRPTGWTYSPPTGTNTIPTVSSIISNQPHRDFSFSHLRPMRNSTSTHQLFGVPYSEHSSFYELTCFALSVDWVRIIATVNVESEAGRGKIGAWIARWDAERKKRGKGVVPYRSVDYW
ncbi:DNA repair metallo-beta-lactamase-domain-containing protein [Amylostereum chailletii]|nr:DNA repair metallo-beta-lactamase-domain-containing protein [Amylostereum chailletii]